MKVQLSDFCSAPSDENFASTVQHALPLNLFPEFTPLCKDPTVATGLINTSPSLEPCRASIIAILNIPYPKHEASLPQDIFPMQGYRALLKAVCTETAELVPTEAHQSRATHRLPCVCGKQLSCKKTDRSCTTISPAETAYPQFSFHM